jgi:hypothetical protein
LSCHPAHAMLLTSSLSVLVTTFLVTHVLANFLCCGHSCSDYFLHSCHIIKHLYKTSKSSQQWNRFLCVCFCRSFLLQARHWHTSTTLEVFKFITTIHTLSKLCQSIFHSIHKAVSFLNFLLFLFLHPAFNCRLFLNLHFEVTQFLQITHRVKSLKVTIANVCNKR